VAQDHQADHASAAPTPLRENAKRLNDIRASMVQPSAAPSNAIIAMVWPCLTSAAVRMSSATSMSASRIRSAMAGAILHGSLMGIPFLSVIGLLGRAGVPGVGLQRDLSALTGSAAMAQRR